MAKRQDFCSKLKKYIDDHGENIVGRHVWYCPNKSQRLECVINNDGTISVAGFQEQRFKTATDLVKALQDGSIVVESFKMPRKNKLKSCPPFSTNLVFQPDGTNQVMYYVNNPMLRLPIDSHRRDGSPNQGASTSGANATRSNVCPGFVIPDWNKCDFQYRSLKVDGSRMRSWRCTGFKKQKAELCTNCSHGKHFGDKMMKNRKCPGIDPSHQPTISQLGWDADRNRFSGLDIGPTSTKSKECRTIKKADQSVCTPCKKKTNVIRSRKRKLEGHPTPAAKRLKFTADQYLTTPEKTERRKMLAKQAKRLSCDLNLSKRRVKRTDTELSRYRPANRLIRKAVLATKESLERDHDRATALRCEWMDADHQCHGLPANPTVDQVINHVKECHLGQIFEYNKNLPPYQRQYVCKWSNCRCRGGNRVFRNLATLTRHILNNHIGTKKHSEALDARVNSLLNQNRKPQGRRYNLATMRISSRSYRSRASWNRARQASATPMPTVASIAAFRRKVGGQVRAGVDHGVIADFKRKTADKPEFRRGILVFDEMHVREHVKFNSKTLETFGFADDVPGAKAKQILVFQYISIFSKQRFALNVAWYACANLTAKKLQQWFWEVVHALAFNGFTVLATVCDGSGPNRSFQAACLGINRERKWMRNRAEPRKRIYILSDPSHAIKKLRNSWMSRKRMLLKGDRWIRWYYIEKVHEWQERRTRTAKLVDRCLTKRHIKMNSFGQMRVQFAVDVFSHPIENIILQDDGKEIGTRDETEATRRFIAVGRKFWLAMNSKKLLMRGQNQQIRDDLEDVMTYFDEWLEEINRSVEDEVVKHKNQCPNASQAKLDRVRRAVKPTRMLRFITKQCYDDLALICKGVPDFIEYVFAHSDIPFMPKAITQDRLEADFSLLRTRAGSGMNPTIYDAAYVLKSINVRRLSDL